MVNSACVGAACSFQLASVLAHLPSEDTSSLLPSLLSLGV